MGGYCLGAVSDRMILVVVGYGAIRVFDVRRRRGIALSCIVRKAVGTIVVVLVMMIPFCFLANRIEFIVDSVEMGWTCFGVVFDFGVALEELGIVRPAKDDVFSARGGRGEDDAQQRVSHGDDRLEESARVACQKIGCCCCAGKVLFTTEAWLSRRTKRWRGDGRLVTTGRGWMLG